ECRADLKGLDFAEIRIDKTPLTLIEIKELFAEPITLIATCRPGTRPDEDRLAALLAAIASGAAYVDIEVEAPAAFRADVLAAAREKSCKVIISYHNNNETPLRHYLTQVIESCFDHGADIAKVICRVRNTQDCVRILSLYEARKNLIALGMGELGVITRIAAPFLGAPLTYAALAPGKETAEGQPDLATLQAVLKLVKTT
ncbi:MAG TPA: type I 3-dehydroquinate dehydratase, partial [Burkholderiales bacterium]|nr:type I 3-dehydroquinate dehydratase [Burkholderiales bacterium]